MRVALITGSSRGLGLALCQALKQKGYTIVATVRTQKDITRLEREHNDVHFIPCDVTSTRDVKALKKTVLMRFHRLDILINNAGILPDNERPGEFLDHSLINTPIKHFQKALNVNALGAIRMAKSFIPLLISTQNGEKKIINISSQAGQLSSLSWGLPAYSLSKVALNAATQLIASEFDGHNIICVSVSPGWVRTDMGGTQADQDVDHAAHSLVHLILQLTREDNGKFLRNGHSISW